MCESLKPLFEKLTKAKFSGELRLVFEAGKVTAGKIKHYLLLSEIGRELPTIEQEEEFTLKSQN